MASFTNWDDDPNGSAFDDVDFAAPGVNVLSYINDKGQLIVEWYINGYTNCSRFDVDD